VSSSTSSGVKLSQSYPPLLHPQVSSPLHCQTSSLDFLADQESPLSVDRSESLHHLGWLEILPYLRQFEALLLDSLETLSSCDPPKVDGLTLIRNLGRLVTVPSPGQSEAFATCVNQVPKISLALPMGTDGVSRAQPV
jgi:hypothetical protein